MAASSSLHVRSVISWTGSMLSLVSSTGQFQAACQLLKEVLHNKGLLGSAICL